MSEIISLRQARKRLARAADEEAAAVNRAKHGQTKAERALTKIRTDKVRGLLDGAKREGPDT